ncbi:hypothetical protein EVAR_7025_1 [Eumeta japonica]|uniref:Uncharacterized protein n=1 Tax=Eumeta variegata TaxID=151549 RepID=A0A4C1TGR1_EUMVA|nr:hypothetical protein EVAR_7025_1 [Eumeta japonica]
MYVHASEPADGTLVLDVVLPTQKQKKNNYNSPSINKGNNVAQSAYSEIVAAGRRNVVVMEKIFLLSGIFLNLAAPRRSSGWVFRVVHASVRVVSNLRRYLIPAQLVFVDDDDHLPSGGSKARFHVETFTKRNLNGASLSAVS